MKLLFFSAFALLNLFSISSVHAADTPLFSHYPESRVRHTHTLEYSTSSIPYDTRASSAEPKILEGDINKYTLEIKNISTKKIFENYKSAALDTGFTIVMECALEQCGSEKDSKWLGNTIAIKRIYNFYQKPYYFVAEKGEEGAKVIAAFFIGGYGEKAGIQELIITQTTPVLGLVKVNKTYLEKALLAEPEKVVAGEAMKNDHALLPRYPGARLRIFENTDYQTFAMPNPVKDTNGIFVANWGSQDLVGDLAQHYYSLKNVSSYKLFSNYRHALEIAGFTITANCELDQCGNDEQAKALGNALSIQRVYNDYKSPYFLLAKKGVVHVGIFIGAHQDKASVQQVIIETEELTTGLVLINAEDLKRQIDDSGRALVYGIFFDTNKAEVKDESGPALKAIAELLNKNSDLNLYVVGHTDDTGGLDRNMSLSQARANAITSLLSNQYKINKTRLMAKGVGPFSPTGSNLSESGKEKNRRVELVKRISK